MKPTKVSNLFNLTPSINFYSVMIFERSPFHNLRLLEEQPVRVVRAKIIFVDNSLILPDSGTYCNGPLSGAVVCVVGCVTGATLSPQI